MEPQADCAGRQDAWLVDGSELLRAQQVMLHRASSSKQHWQWETGSGKLMGSNRALPPATCQLFG
jgi:hypothetical protein